MQRHASNLPPDAQPWGRDIEAELDELATGDTDLAAQLAEANSRYSTLLSEFGKLRVDLLALYTATGTTYPPGPPVPPPSIPPAPAVAELLQGASWSRTWGSSTFYTGSATHTNGTYLYQGSNPENKIGMFGFDLSAVRNKNIISGSLFMANINTAWQPTVSADFGTHNHASPPSGKPGRINPFSTGWSRGEHKWQPLERWVLDGISNGAVSGFTIGGSGASDANYAYWQGVGQAAPPVIRLSYNA